MNFRNISLLSTRNYVLTSRKINSLILISLLLLTFMFSIKFMTGHEVYGATISSDTPKPTVTSTSPGGGTSNIQVNSVIKVTFSEPMLSSSISTNTFTLRIADTTTKLEVIVSLSLDGKTATFDPSPNLVILQLDTLLQFLQGQRIWPEMP